MDWKKNLAERKDERRSDPVTPIDNAPDFAELEDDVDRQQEQNEQSDSLHPNRGSVPQPACIPQPDQSDESGRQP